VNLREFAVLEAMNIATTQHQVPPPRGACFADRLRWDGYRATAAEVAQTLIDDDRLAELGAFLYLSPREVGAMLGRMALGLPERREPLVEKVTSRHWRMTDAGVKALSS
jgi:hypothetical protein